MFVVERGRTQLPSEARTRGGPQAFVHLQPQHSQEMPSPVGKIQPIVPRQLPPFPRQSWLGTEGQPDLASSSAGCSAGVGTHWTTSRWEQPSPPVWWVAGLWHSRPLRGAGARRAPAHPCPPPVMVFAASVTDMEGLNCSNLCNLLTEIKTSPRPQTLSLSFQDSASSDYSWGKPFSF